MPYVFPPMDPEPPRDFLDFVAVHLADLQRDTARLLCDADLGAAGPRDAGPRDADPRDADPRDADPADEIHTAVLCDLAGHWRRLRVRRAVRRRLGRAGDPAVEALHRRVEVRTRQWREDQIHPVQVEFVGSRPATFVGGWGGGPAGSIALRKAQLLPGTARRQARPLAEASIAWEHAGRQAYWRRVARVVVTVLVVFFAVMNSLPSPS